MLATATLAGMARVGRIDPLSGHAVHDGSTEVGCTVGLGQTWVDPLDQLRHRPLGCGSSAIRGRCRPSGISHSGIGMPTAGSCGFSDPT